MNLKDAMRVSPGECIAFSGAGGKTTALFSLAREVPGPVLVTTTTRFGLDQISLADKVLPVDPSTNINKVIDSLENEVTLLRGEIDEQGKVAGIPAIKLEELYQASRGKEITILIEADGSRQLPMKAPADHEPVIPLFVDLVVVVAGLSGLGKPLDENWVHRVEQFARISGLDYGAPLTRSAVVDVLRHANGGSKGIPSNAKRVVLLNQADNPELQAQGNNIARRLADDFDAVIVASLLKINDSPDAFADNPSMVESNVYAAHEPIAAVVLAGGKSERMGRTKQLLPWKGKSLLWHVTQSAIQEGIKDIIIVTGADGENIRNSLQDLPVRFIDNPDWQLGQSTSLKAGLSNVPQRTGAVIFLLADQPQVSHTLIHALIERHAATLAPIVAPMVDGKRGNPVLFDRITFEDLLKVQGDRGGREIFSRYPIDWVQWHDVSALLDIDTEADYQKLLEG